MITDAHYETRYVEPEVYVEQTIIDDREVALDQIDVLSMAKDRLQYRLVHNVQGKIEPGRDLLVRMDLKTEYLPEQRAHRIRGRLKVMPSPCELRPARYMAANALPEIVEVEKPAEGMPAGTLAAGLARKFWGHLKSMTQELQYDGPRG